MTDDQKKAIRNAAEIIISGFASNAGISHDAWAAEAASIIERELTAIEPSIETDEDRFPPPGFEPCIR